jgi:hypothetical protein
MEVNPSGPVPVIPGQAKKWGSRRTTAVWRVQRTAGGALHREPSSSFEPVQGLLSRTFTVHSTCHDHSVAQRMTTPGHKKPVLSHKTDASLISKLKESDPSVG